MEIDLSNRKHIAYLLLGVGATILACQALVFFVSTFWAFMFIMLPGMVMLGLGLNNIPTRYMVIPGTVITMTGSILQFMSIFGHWEAWAYSWALVPVALGVAFQYLGEHGDKGLADLGKPFVNLGLMGFFGLGFFFEFFIFGTFGTVGTFAIAALLVVGGMFLLRGENDWEGLEEFTARFDKRKKKKREFVVGSNDKVIDGEFQEEEKAGIYY